ncbi:hypothetical protein LAZ67_2001332 [Cordylochernes scorpioides]|uniref:Retrovirus-related Pol polyprotein from type-1 retrotransposable element R1 n=1 Tax=Cordylochernes scorpioides TaxID=51811 RepID=A0ABY6K1W5_9ARAC|nr:hypothetical protein LAZ67_2001332 [Cordylochernes scorpioides]
MKHKVNSSPQGSDAPDTPASPEKPEREEKMDHLSPPDIRHKSVINMEVPVDPFMLIDFTPEARIGPTVEESEVGIDFSKPGYLNDLNDFLNQALTPQKKSAELTELAEAFHDSLATIRRGRKVGNVHPNILEQCFDKLLNKHRAAIEELELLRVEKRKLEEKILSPTTLQYGIERGVAAALAESLKTAEVEEMYLEDDGRMGLDTRYSFFSSECKKAALLVRGDLPCLGCGSWEGAAAVQIEAADLKLVCLSVYIPPHDNNLGRLDFLNDLLVQKERHKIVIGGDFNAHTQLFGDREENRKGRSLVDLVIGQGLEVWNVYGESTFATVNSESIIDFSLAKTSRMRRLMWETDPTDVSDHKLIRFEASCDVKPPSVERVPRYSIRGPNLERFRRRFVCTLEGNLTGAVNRIAINSMVNEFHQDIINTCRALGPGSGKVTTFKRLKQPWWTEELEIERKRVRAMRRLFQNSVGEERIKRGIAYRKILAGYKRRTKRVRRRHWREQCNTILEINPYGLPYRVVTGKIRSSANLRLLEEEDGFKTRDLKETLDLILDRHFGNEEPEDEISLTTCGLVDPPFSEMEVKRTAFKFGNRKSPGPDGIDNTIVKALVRMHPSLLARLFNRCLDTGTFPKAWKVARVVLLEKSGRKGNSPIDYRPLSLLACLGKVLDILLAQRLKHWLESNELLSSSQHGFREGKSTTTALNEVLEGVEIGLKKGAWVLLVALDIDGAFNSMNWKKLMRNLMDKGCPDNLCSLVRDFLRDRRVSLSFGGLKLEELPEGARLVLYADDQFLIIEAASRAKAEKAWWRRNKDQKVATTLERVQRTAALRITGGYRTTSTEALLVLAGLIPLGLKPEEEAIRQKIWEDREDALGLEAGTLEWKRDPRKPPQWLPKWNWSPGVPTGIGTEVFTDGSKSGTNTGAGVVIFTNGELIFQESLTLRVDELVYSAELVAIREALRVCAEKNLSSDRLYSDCMSALVAINLEKGQLAHQIIQELEMMSRAPDLHWVRGHSLIEAKSSANPASVERTPRYSVRGANIARFLEKFNTELENDLELAVDGDGLDRAVDRFHLDIITTSRGLGPGTGSVISFKRKKHPWWSDDLEVERKRI